ncbi:hypothetical protein PHMEG_00030797, partial [Phytophthora megakarya]
HEADLDQDPDLEEKSRSPLKAAAAVTADLDENLDPYTTDKDVTKSKLNLSPKSAASTRSSKKKKVKAARMKLKAPDSESEDLRKPRSTIAKDMIEPAYYRKILTETLLHDPLLVIIQVRQIGDLTGPVSKPNTSSDRLNAVKNVMDLLQEAGLVAGEFDPDSLFEMELGGIQASTHDLYKYLKILVGKRVQTPDRNYQTGSSHNASVTSEPDSDSPRAPQRINRLDRYFQMAMNRFPKEQSLVTVQSPPLWTQDIDMESVGTPNPHYDPDDLGIPSSSGHDAGRAVFASAAIGSGRSSLIQRVRISDEDRARAWMGKVKSAFQRDQATEEEKCLTFADLMVGPTKN